MTLDVLCVLGTRCVQVRRYEASPGRLQPAEAHASNIHGKDRKMQVKVSPVEYRDEVAARTLAASFRPARLNFAQVCLWCGVRWCESTVCVEMWAEALWGPCDTCDGFGSLVSCLMCVN